MTMHFTYIYTLLVVSLSTAISQNACLPFATATGNLREVIIGSCTIYQENINQPVFCTEGFRNCTEIWEAFSGAFLNQPQCNVSDKRLDKYIRLTDHSIPKDKSLFWHKIYPFVKRFSNMGQRYYVLSDTLPGYIGNGLKWCSDPNEPMGLSPEGTLCPGFGVSGDCAQSAERAFWIATSKNFGLRASGEIFILLNATFNPIFSNDSYNAVYELPYLRENIVTKATVLLINEKPVQGQTKCNDPSLRTIEMTVGVKRIAYACIENRRDVVETFCLDNPTSEICKLLERPSSSPPIVG